MLTETVAPKGESFGSRLCIAWERAARNAEALGTRVCLLRTGPVLGADGGFLQRMLFPFRLGLGGPVGNGRQWLAWIHREDHLRMIRFLMEHERLDGAFNAVAPQPVTSREFARILGRVLGRPARLPVPAVVIQLLLGEQAELLLGSQRAVPRRFEEAGFRFHYPELESALGQLVG